MVTDYNISDEISEQEFPTKDAVFDLILMHAY